MTSSKARDLFKLVGTTLDGKFAIDRAIAEGGFGVVYHGIHSLLGRPIALKVLKEQTNLSPEERAAFVDSFMHEARTIIQIQHPNIVQVLDFGISLMPNGERCPWMALEWLDGPTLRSELMARRNRGGRAPAEALALMRPILDAVACAHEQGVAHRDLKPANIIIAETRRGRMLKLLDFGIAKSMDAADDAGSGNTQTAAALQAFSLPYAAPEQVGGTRTGPWTDVHALALMLTEVLVDKSPYQGDDRTELMCRVLAPERPTPGAFGMDVGPWEAILRRALAIKPSDRYRSAGELLGALEATLPSGRNPSLQSTQQGLPSTTFTNYVPPGQTGPNTAFPAEYQLHTADASGPVQPSMTGLMGHHTPPDPTTLRGATTGVHHDAAGRPRRSQLSIIISVGLMMAATGGGLGLVWAARSRSEQTPAQPQEPSAPPVIPGGNAATTPAPIGTTTPPLQPNHLGANTNTGGGSVLPSNNPNIVVPPGLQPVIPAAVDAGAMVPVQLLPATPTPPSRPRPNRHPSRPPNTTPTVIDPTRPVPVE